MTHERRDESEGTDSEPGKRRDARCPRERTERRGTPRRRVRGRRGERVVPDEETSSGTHMCFSSGSSSRFFFFFASPLLTRASFGFKMRFTSANFFVFARFLPMVPERRRPSARPSSRFARAREGTSSMRRRVRLGGGLGRARVSFSRTPPPRARLCVHAAPPTHSSRAAGGRAPACRRSSSAAALNVAGASGLQTCAK